MTVTAILLFALIGLPELSAQSDGVLITGVTQERTKVILGRAAPYASEYVFEPATFDPVEAASITKVFGLEELPNLLRLYFSGVGYIADVSWVARLDDLQLLVFHDCAVPVIKPLLRLSSLRELYVVLSDLRAPLPARIDLAGLENLEVLSFGGTYLNALPRFTRIPPSLEYVDLSYCGLNLDAPEARAALESLRDVGRVNVTGNFVSPETLQEFRFLHLDSERTDG